MEHDTNIEEALAVASPMASKRSSSIAKADSLARARWRGQCTMYSGIGTAIFGTLFGLATTSTTLMVFGGLMAFFLALGSTAIYSYTPELYPTEIRATGMGLASAWGRAGAIILLLVFGVFAVLKGKVFVFLISDVVLLLGAIVIAKFGPSTKGRSLEDASK